MSRSNPQSNTPNPATRFFEWKGATGTLCHYDKEKKENITVPNGFTFLVLDQLNCVTGYNKKAKVGLFSNEVRDTTTDPFVVKFFDGEHIAEGLWAAIKEKVAFKKGQFAKSVYIAFKGDDGKLTLGNIRFTGCSLGPWFDFTKANRKACDSGAIVIKAGKRDESGDVEFTPPTFSCIEVSEETNKAAIELDLQLQEFLTGYFQRTHTDRATDGIHQPDAPDDVPEHREDTTDHTEKEVFDESEQVPF